MMRFTFHHHNHLLLIGSVLGPIQIAFSRIQRQDRDITRLGEQGYSSLVGVEIVCGCSSVASDLR